MGECFFFASISVSSIVLLDTNGKLRNLYRYGAIFYRKVSSVLWIKSCQFEEKNDRVQTRWMLQWSLVYKKWNICKLLNDLTQRRDKITITSIRRRVFLLSTLLFVEISSVYLNKENSRVQSVQTRQRFRFHFRVWKWNDNNRHGRRFPREVRDIASQFRS